MTNNVFKASGTDIHFYTEGRNGGKLVTELIVSISYLDTNLPESFPESEPESIPEELANGWQLNLGQFAESANFASLGDISYARVVVTLPPPRRGTLCGYFKVPSDTAYTLLDQQSLEDGAMMEPLAVAIHAVCSLGKLSAGQSVALFGCGPVGLLCMAVAQALGSTRIIVVDKVVQRVEFATKYAATDSFTPPEFLPDDTVKEYSTRASALFRKKFGPQEDGSGIDLIVDASGAEICLQMGLLVAKNGGTFVQVGVGRTDVQFPISVVMNKELTVKGSLRYGPGDYPLAISLASSGRVNLKLLVTHRFEFVDSIAAFETTKSGRDSDGNAVLKTTISGPSDKETNGTTKGHSGETSPATLNGIVDEFSDGHDHVRWI